MNLVLFEQHELNASLLTISDFRAKHIRTVLKLKVGDTLRIGMVNGGIGMGELVSIDAAAVEIKVRLDREPPPPPDVELILALPRPIMLRRILKQATVLGVRRIHLIRSAKVEKSFFQTPVLEPEKIRSLLLEGLAQAVDTHLPGVLVYHRFKPFIQDIVPKMKGCGFIAHPGIPTSLLAALTEIYPNSQEHQKILLAVGPEGGWNDFEVRCFVELGFAGFSMGNRILHVDTAVVALLAQLTQLRELRKSINKKEMPRQVR
ncbi:MAG: 16S rRNA (uracil(1498)-N(3))-methyltransferase [Candidatus Electrothrix sp. AR4]|nr:16S rRNA (uracil(1498)-N(3))-methyltransferase [Candidatus Electrothrix sp. AR4]